MAFEKNQQDQFNMNNGIDQVKQFQAELDKATAAIGAAELAAEEEQLGIKLKNLDTLQKTRLKQLDQLIALEEEGIQELAKLKSTLSRRQFDIRKKEIQKEFQLAKKAVEKLFELEDQKRSAKKPSNAATKKPPSTTKDIAEATKAKPSNTTKPTPKVVSQDINKLLRSIDDTLSTLQDSVVAIRQQVEKDLLATANAQTDVARASTPNNISELPTPEVTVDLDPTKLTPNITVEAPQPIVEPTPVIIEQPPIEVDQAPITVEPNIIVEPTPVVVEQPPKDAVAAPIIVEPNPVIVEPTPIIVEPKVDPIINVTPTPVNVEPNIVVEPTPVVVEPTPIAVEQPPVVVEPPIVEPNIIVEPKIAVEPTPIIVEPNIVVEPAKPAEILLEAPKIEIPERGYSNSLDGLKEVSLDESSVIYLNDLLDGLQKYVASVAESDNNGSSLVGLENAIKAVQSEKPATALMPTKQDTVSNTGDNFNIPEVSSLTASIDEASSKLNTLESIRDTLISLRADLTTQLNTQNGLIQSITGKSKEKSTGNTPPSTPGSAKQVTGEPSSERQFSSDAKGMEEQDLGKYRIEEVIANFTASLAKIQAQNPNIEKVLNEVTAEDNTSSQTSIDLAGELLKSFEAAENAARKIREFNANDTRNKQLQFLTEEQNLRKKHEQSAFDSIIANITAAAKAEDLAKNATLYLTEEEFRLKRAFAEEENKITAELLKLQADQEFAFTHENELLEQEGHKLRTEHEKALYKTMLDNISARAKADDIRDKKNLYLSEAHDKLAKDHLEKQNQLALAAIDSEAKANDLKHNKALYLAEEEAKLKNAFTEEENKLTEELLKTQAAQDFAFTHKSELLEQESHKLRNEHEKALHKTMLADIATRAKADDIRANKNLYLSEAHDKLATGHAEKQNQLRLAAIDNEAKANDLVTHKQLYELETRIARENAFAADKNKLTEDLIAAEENLKYTSSHKQELLDQEVFKLRVGHADIENKARLDLIAAEAKKKDLEFNEAKYRAEAQDALKLAHEQEQNKLAEDIIKAEEKRNDLLHNKKLYDQEEEKRLNKALIEDQNKLTEDSYKTQKSIAFTQAHEDELRAIEHQKLINQHATDYDKYLKDILAADEKAKDLEHNRAEYLNKELDNLERGHKEQQNKLTQDLINAEAKGIDLKLNKEQYIAEEKARLDKEFAEKNNKLTEDAYKRKAQLDYIEANKKELIEQNLAELRSQHADEEIKRREAHNKELARAIMLREDESKLLEDDIKKFADARAKKHNDLTEEARGTKAEYTDIQNNEDDYRDLARQEYENAFYAERNRLLKESFAIEEGIAWDKAHMDEVMAQERHKKQMGWAKAYADYQKKAGIFAIDQAKFEKEQAAQANKAARKEATSGTVDAIASGQLSKIFSAENRQARAEYLGQRTAELQESGLDESSAKLSAQFELLAEAAGGLQAVLDSNVKQISSVQGVVDTRLQGSQVNDKWVFSYWNKLLMDAKGIAGASPFIRQESLVDNMKALVEKGISFDIKQRAFLMTIQEKIANTFNVADGTLLRLIRIQQEDTTAGRLGMESALNSFLNQMYETSEYLSDVASNVRGSLEEMQALMGGAAATEIEFQVQKWMGSLYSVGMSQDAVQGIAQAFGQIASGDISGLTGSGTGNLLIMAANEAGQSIADILQAGLDADETDKLMEAMVNYLAEIAESSKDSRVVQQQLASVYGIKASDLKAATNLSSSVKDISKKDATYDSMLKQLETMMNSMRWRTSTAEGMTNMWDNIMYSMASTQASNPILYMLPKMANLLRDVTGGSGIDLPFLNVYGFGVDLNTSVADLMSIASMAGTALGALGPAITGLVDLVNPWVGTSMLKRAEIDTKGGKIPVLARGAGSPLQNLGGAGLSESGLVGNSSGDDVKNATMQDAEDDKKKQMVEAKDEESADDVATKANLAVVNIYNLLEEVAHGSQSLRVRVINNIGCGGSGGSNGNQSSENEGDGNTTAGTGAGKYGTDNGNWVLTF